MSPSTPVRRPPPALDPQHPATPPTPHPAHVSPAPPPFPPPGPRALDAARPTRSLHGCAQRRQPALHAARVAARRRCTPTLPSLHAARRRSRLHADARGCLRSTQRSVLDARRSVLDARRSVLDAACNRRRLRSPPPVSRTPHSPPPALAAARARRPRLAHTAHRPRSTLTAPARRPPPPHAVPRPRSISGPQAQGIPCVRGPEIM
ncbi:hypothetical protein FA95DRAFT_1614197 [Auriscalpium vulgare]|uniref:Uncharacterized protein n=1 Tax=Auriscalpium vulgare TaxID=40419 RepID=A0ACB8R0Y2_9AGAM|nr:hypothetical protein FA95DRAFT_1614197 [Auriscalpium vulgare]